LTHHQHPLAPPPNPLPTSVHLPHSSLSAIDAQPASRFSLPPAHCLHACQQQRAAGCPVSCVTSAPTLRLAASQRPQCLPSYTRSFPPLVIHAAGRGRVPPGCQQGPAALQGHPLKDVGRKGGQRRSADEERGPSRQPDTHVNVCVCVCVCVCV
jgi:hypothetical protein